MSNKIEMLDIVVMNHTEYLPRSQLQALGSPDLKQSPKVSKNMGKRGAKQPPQPQIQLPESMVTPNGVPNSSFREYRLPIVAFESSTRAETPALRSLEAGRR